MARDVMFGKGRDWRPDDREYRRLRLGPGRGAQVGEYATDEPGEYSDSYYGPGDAYARRSDASDGYVRDQFGPRANVNAPVGGAAGARGAAGNPDYVGYGRLEPGARSWADLGVHSVRAGESGVTERAASYRGRGPKGYRRSDERLQELICERLTEDPYIDASDIDVAVESGEITLSGAVADRRMKWRAEDLAEACSDGALIQNRLRVQYNSTQR